MKIFLVITCVAVAASVGALDPALEAKLQKALQDVVEVKQKQYGTLPQSSSVTRIINKYEYTVQWLSLLDFLLPLPVPWCIYCRSLNTIEQYTMLSRGGLLKIALPAPASTQALQLNPFILFYN